MMESAQKVNQGSEDLKFVELNKPTKVVLASSSKFLLEGIRKVLEYERDIKIVAEALNREGIEDYLTETRPDLLFIDNRAMGLDVRELLNLINRIGSGTKIILLGDHTKHKLNFPNVLHIAKETNSSELVSAIKKSLNKDTQINIEEYKPKTLSRLDDPEEVIELTDEVLPTVDEGEEIDGYKEYEEKTLFEDEVILPERGQIRTQGKFKNPRSPYRWGDGKRRRRHSKSVRVFSGIIVTLLSIIGVVYIGHSYFDWKSYPIESIAENLFPPNDSEIKSGIETELWKQGYEDVGVIVTNGKAVLSGNVPGEKDREIIYTTVRGTEGVKEVQSNVSVEEAASDEDVASAVRNEIEDKGYRNVSVNVEGGKLTLSGTVPTPEEYRLLRHTVENLDGVKEVENNVEIAKTPTDSEIASAVRKNLDGRGYKSIDVSVTHRRAVLSGTALSREEQKTIQDVAMNTEGLEVVENNVKVLPKASVDRKLASGTKEESADTDGKPGERGLNAGKRKTVLRDIAKNVRKKNPENTSTAGAGRGEDAIDNLNVTKARSDKNTLIASEIKREFDSKGYRDINVSVTDGEVFLTGTVKTHRGHVHLHQIALKVEGVRRVRSDLAVLEYSKRPEKVSRK